MKIVKITVYVVLYLFTSGIVASSFLLTPHPLNSPALSIIRTIIIIFATILLSRYTLYMVVSPWNAIIMARDKELLSHFVKDYRPLVSVMIPAWNEEVGLLFTIKTLLESTYKHLEIVVVNDGSTDDSDAMMRKFVARYETEMAEIPESERIRMVYHYQKNGGKGSALNTAIKLSHGDILMSIDADCTVHSGCVAAFVDAFRDPRTMAAVGNVKIGNTKSLIGTIQYLEFAFSFLLKNADSVMNTVYIIGGAAGAFRREVFEKIGGYSTHNITEDIQLSMRIQDRGWKIVYVPTAYVSTEGASTLQGLMKQRLRWKRGRFQTFWEYRHMFFSLAPHHNKLLCWLILPMAMFSEVQLGLEPLFLLALYIFSFLSGDFSAFLSGVAVVLLMFLVQGWDAREEQEIGYVLLAPVGWLLFYVCTYVEFYSLVKSIWMTVRKQDLKWQKWTRQRSFD